MSVEMLTLKVVSPLALHRRRASEQFASTLDYIPGSAVRGAFADLYLAGRLERAQEDDFKQLFLADAVRFSDFFPTTGETNELTRLRPATAVECKRFAERHRDEKQDSLSDSLLFLELVSEWRNPDLGAIEEWNECPVCKQQGRKYSKRDRAELGYYLSVDKPKPIEVHKRMIANTAIQRKTRTAASGMLFSHEVIEESSTQEHGEEVLFRGTIMVPNQHLRQMLHDLAPDKQELAVGYGRSRGLGLLQVASWGTPRPDVTTVQQRWIALNETIGKLWQKYGRVPAGQYFSLTLQSHLAIRDEAGQPVLDVQARHLGLPDEAKRCRCVLSAVVVPGWNAAAELPKADTWALGRGSVLLFRLPRDVDPAPTRKRLEEIERDGVGERTAEGFGSIIACDPFHYSLDAS